MKRTALVLSIALPALAGCTADMKGDNATENDPSNTADTEGTENVATTGQAITLLNACATGTAANASGNLWTVGVWDQFTHAYQYKTTPGICSTPRETTIVDFDVQGLHQYRFEVRSTFWTPTNASQCSQLQAAMRMQHKNSSGAWVDDPEDYIVRNGSWTVDFSQPYLGKCSLPVPYGSLVNFASGPAQLRVRAWGRQWDGSPATVNIRAVRLAD